MTEAPSGPCLPFRQARHALGYPILELPADEAIATPLPEVIIALGSETAQLRAERVFLYSILKHRDPKRAYRIHVMRDLPGFAGEKWRTGFTNYRFAIPGLVEGKAIYNDVDQIYLDDPARLFDLPLGEAGFLALSADDTAAMLGEAIATGKPLAIAMLPAGQLPWWHRQRQRLRLLDPDRTILGSRNVPRQQRRRGPLARCPGHPWPAAAPQGHAQAPPGRACQRLGGGVWRG